MESRDVINAVREAFEIAKRVEGVGYEDIVSELEAEAEHGLKVIQDVIDGMAKQRRLWITNDMDARIAKGDVNGSYNVERLSEIKVLFDNFAKWVETPLIVKYADGELETPEIALPPIVIVSRRGNPPSNWGIEVKDGL